MARLLVLLPSFNEEQALPALLEQLATVRDELQPDWSLSVLVVDDGSSDQTAACAQAGSGELRVQLVRHGANRGLGAALRTGIEYFLEQPGDDDPQAVLAVMDADGTHPPQLLPMMLGRLKQEKLDELAADDSFLSQLERAGQRFERYMTRKTWYDRQYENECGDPVVA